MMDLTLDEQRAIVEARHAEILRIVVQSRRATLSNREALIAILAMVILWLALWR